MYKLFISKLAHDDLDSIVSYITNKLSNPTAAINLLDEIESCYQHLVDNPHIYEICQDDFLSQLSYRKIAIKKYIVIYKIDEETNTVYVLRFFTTHRIIQN